MYAMIVTFKSYSVSVRLNQLTCCVFALLCFRISFMRSKMLTGFPWVSSVYKANAVILVILVNEPTRRTVSQCVYFMPLHVSSNKCSSSGWPTCVNTSSGITHSGGWMPEVPVRWKPPPDRHVRPPPTRVCYTRWCIDTKWSSWWWALVARNM
jgi:hypothetical protein